MTTGRAADRRAEDYIVFPLDVPTLEAALDLVRRLAGGVGMFKIGLELFVGHGPAVVDAVRRAGATRIFLDLKLHDIPATVERAMQRVADLGVDCVTVHCGESRAMLEAAVEGGAGKVDVLGVTVLTSVGPAALRDAGYPPELADDPRQLVLRRAAMAQAAGCRGVVCSGREVAALKARLGDDFQAVTPGIRPAAGQVARDDQQRILTPAVAIANGADYLVVGRPLRDAPDPRQAARNLALEIGRALGADDRERP